jgi:hypothetical protein
MNHAPTIAGLLAVPAADRRTTWLTDSLQVAARLEFFTIPPYLCAMWSIEDGSGLVYDSLHEIVMEEMLHLGLVCNLLNALGETPRLYPDAAPEYPRSLPGGVRPGLVVPLARLSLTRVRDVFMQIERPHDDVFDPNVPNVNATIGQFYAAIAAVVQTLADSDFAGGKQLTRGMGSDARPMFAVTNRQSALDALELVTEQGEGTSASPRDPTAGGSADADDLAHYYRFTEMLAGKRIDPTTGRFRDPVVPLPLPSITPMADVPDGGWRGKPGVPPEVEAKLLAFDQQYTTMVQKLHEAWATGSPGPLGVSVSAMRGLSVKAVELMSFEIAVGGERYGPGFRLV